jgi:anti-anti-sigma factor
VNAAALTGDDPIAALPWTRHYGKVDLGEDFARWDDTPFTVSVHRWGPRTHIVLVGEFDFDRVGVFDTAVADLRRAPGFAVTELNLTDLRFLDCAGVFAILRLHADVTPGGRALVIVDPQPIVRRMLDLTGVLGRVPVRDTFVTAVGSARWSPWASGL